MFKRKKTITNTGMVDFRRYTPDALKKIKKITCAGLIILPENPSAEFMQAFSEIEIICSGNIINLAENAELKTINGSGILTGNIDKNSIYMVNGSTIVYSVKGDAPIKMMVNGLVVYEKGTNIDFININGRTVPVNRSLSENITYSRDIEINSSVVKNYKNGIVIIADHDLILTSDITEEMLAEKELYFIAGHDIVCPHGIYGYIAANSTAGHKIKV